jgi:putative DNA primase/helicase
MDLTKFARRQSLEDFLKERKTKDKFTHTSMEGGKYYIDTESLETFRQLYKTALADGSKLSIIEQHRDLSPVLLDFDLRFPAEQTKRAYTFDHIKRFLRSYIEVLGQYVDLAEASEHSVVLMEKPAPRQEKGVTKDGFHVVLPTVVTRPSVQYLVRDACMDAVEEFRTAVGCINTADDIFDKAVIEKNGWFMYGSSKPRLPGREVTHHMSLDLKELDMLSTDAYVDLLSILGHHVQTALLPTNEAAVKAMDQTLWNKRYGTSSASSGPKPSASARKSDVSIQDLEFVVMGLDPKRAESYESWSKVVWMIACEAPGHVGLSLAERFSQQCPEKFDSEGLNHTFNQANGCLTFGSALHWLRKDNPDAYDHYTANQLRSRLRAACDETEYNMARVMHHVYADRFVNVVIKERNYWFEFTDHRWTVVNSNSLKRLMSTEVADTFRGEISKDMALAASPDANTEQKQHTDSRVKKYNKLVTKLGKTSFKNSTAEQCAILFEKHQKEFYDKLDENPALIGFTNGVFDLDANEFRDGRPEDMVTHCTGYPYTSEINAEVRGALQRFYESIFNEEEVIQYALTVMAYHLHGNKRFEEFWVRTGSGSNGKGVEAALAENTFGEYFYSPDITIFTTKKTDASKCSSEIAKAKPKRILITTEPESDDRLQVGTLKKWTGGDKVQARELYKEAIEFTPQFGVNIQTNAIPELSAFDGGVVRRMRVLEYPNKFVETPRLPNERTRDSNMKKTFASVVYAQQFMLMLLEYYQAYVRNANGFVVPQSVMRFTKGYMAEQDAVGSFLGACVEITSSQDDRISASVLRETFNHSDYARTTNMTAKAFADQMKQKGFESRKKGASGCKFYLQVRFKEEQQEDEAEQVVDC